MSDRLVAVRILGLPLDLSQRVSEHNDELLREFALLRAEHAEHVPTRLVALIEELRSRFGPFSEGPRRDLQEALERGEPTVDLQYDVPEEVAGAATRLGTLLDEADEFCRSGDLLTLAAAPDALAFRRWFLEEFVLQAAGGAPREWTAFLEATAPG